MCREAAVSELAVWVTDVVRIRWRVCSRRVKDRMLGIDYSSKNIFHERRKGDTDVQVSCISEKLCETGVTNEISQAAPIISK